jgi:hypothetical protein
MTADEIRLVSDEWQRSLDTTKVNSLRKAHYSRVTKCWPQNRRLKEKGNPKSCHIPSLFETNMNDPNEQIQNSHSRVLKSDRRHLQHTFINATKLETRQLSKAAAHEKAQSDGFLIDFTLLMVF